MNCEIITIGDEILIGQIVDTNSAFMAQELNKIGVNVNRIISISDKKEEIIYSISDSFKRVSLVLMTGGLGPTKDDITKLCLCDFFNTKLEFNEIVFNDIQFYLTSKLSKQNTLNRKQAEVPQNAEIIRNYHGTAPGLWLEKDNKILISMPGVPYEMEEMIKNEVVSKIKSRFSLPTILHKTILTTGTFEARLSEILDDYEKQLPSYIKLAYLPIPGIIKLRLTAKGDDEINLQIEFNNQVNLLINTIPEYIFGYDTETLQSIIGDLLTKRNKSLAIAESCTGGNISKLITSVPGSSKYFLGSVVCYSNTIKEKQLNVDPQLIKLYGAVSKQVVESMAKGVVFNFKSHYAIATSGISGPGGATPEKPVGTTYIAIATQNKVFSWVYSFGNQRERNIERASITALNELRKIILSEE